MTPVIKLDDMKFHVKTRISVLWISTMMCYIYADLLSIYSPGAIQRIMDGNLGGGFHTSPGFLLGSAIVMSIPSVMILLTLVLSASASRRLNLIFGVLSIIIGLATTAGAFLPKFYFYIYFGSIEVVLLGLIVWYAWTWPRLDR